MCMSRYAELAATLQQRIEDGLYAPGTRLPSVRELSREYGVSISTVQQAYLQLEELRLDENYLQDDLNKDLLMEYCAKFQSKALDHRVKLLFKTYDL